ncbi:MAG TPA: cobalamin-dependent protein [Thermoleophilia bacterium]|nr:cobalamin-dependent protein [Thermoleophilia bacterium]
MSDELKEAVIDLREQEALEITDRLLDGGADPLSIVASCKEAMDVIGQRFSCGEAFIPELIMAGEIMKGITAKVKPHLAAGPPAASAGTVVICTVKGDIHDIGKDIVATMLDIAGFTVVDLGVDVAPQTLVEKVRDVRPQVVGLSSLLTVAFDSMKISVAEIDAAGLHDGLKIMVGGAPVNDDVCRFAGADGWAKDAVGAVELAKTWVGGA